MFQFSISIQFVQHEDQRSLRFFKRVPSLLMGTQKMQPAKTKTAIICLGKSAPNAQRNVRHLMLNGWSCSWSKNRAFQKSATDTPMRLVFLLPNMLFVYDGNFPELDFSFDHIKKESSKGASITH